jgi:hypothetical protein
MSKPSYPEFACRTASSPPRPTNSNRRKKVVSRGSTPPSIGRGNGPPEPPYVVTREGIYLRPVDYDARKRHILVRKVAR